MKRWSACANVSTTRATMRSAHRCSGRWSRCSTRATPTLPPEAHHLFLAQARRELGETLGSLGRHAEAETQLALALSALDQVVSEPTVREIERARCHYALGDTYRATRRTAEALDAYGAAVARFERLVRPRSRRRAPASARSQPRGARHGCVRTRCARPGTSSGSPRRSGERLHSRDCRLRIAAGRGAGRQTRRGACGLLQRARLCAGHRRPIRRCRACVPAVPVRLRKAGGARPRAIRAGARDGPLRLGGDFPRAGSLERIHRRLEAGGRPLRAPAAREVLPRSSTSSWAPNSRTFARRARARTAVRRCRLRPNSAHGVPVAG